MANIMYYAWEEHHIRPSDIYKMKNGEFQIIKAFYILDMERRKR